MDSSFFILHFSFFTFHFSLFTCAPLSVVSPLAIEGERGVGGERV